MSVEYVARMEVLQRKREELTAQRQAIEKRLALREATAAEFSAVALQSCKQKWKTQRNAAIAAKKRNDEFVRMICETQKQVHDTWSRLQSDQSSSSALLAQEKARYNRRIEQIYPAWQEQLQRQRVQKLRELEDKKRAVERRRYLAKKSFEKEQTLDDLIQKTRHEVEMAENLEQNELYERELLRTQSTNQAKEVDQSIRDVALEARSYLQQQAAKHFEAVPQLDEEIAEKLSETFSPRHALRALREGSSSLAFEESQQYEEEKPARQIRVEIPARMNSPTRSYYAETNQRGPNHAYPPDDIFENDYRQEFYERLYNPPMNERYQTSTDAGNDYNNFRQSRSIDPSPAEPRDPPTSSTVANLVSMSGHALSRSASSEISRMEQQSAVPSSIHPHNEPRGEEINRPRDSIEVLPTLVTEKLYPIPEANEPISSSGTSLSVPDKVNVRGPDTNHIQDRENTSAGRGHRGTGNSTTIHVAVASRTNSSEPPASNPPVKVEENRIASSPAAPVTIAPLVSGTLHSQVDVGQPVEHQGHADVPEHLIKETAIPEPRAANIPQHNEYFASTPSVFERTAEIPVEVPSHKLNDDLYGKAEDKIPSPVNTSPVDDDLENTSPDVPVDDNSLRVDSVSSQSQPDTTHSTSAPVVAILEGLLETKEVVAEDIDTSESIVGIQVTPRASLKNDTGDIHELRQSLEHDNTNKIDSFHGTDSTLNANLLTTDTFASETVEVTVEMIQESDKEKASTKAPKSLPPAISYRMDLLEPFTPPALTPVKKLLAEDDMLLTSMHSDDFDLSPKSSQPIAETEKPPSLNTDDTTITSVADIVDSAATPETPTPAAEQVNTSSITEKLSPVDRVKALGALISRVEEGATEGDTLGGSMDTESSNESKRELLKMAVGGRKAQIAFFGSDICFELILGISRDLGPILFPPKAFEGIMNDQKIRKLHQGNKEKQLDLWKALSSHLKQLVQLKAIPAATLVDLFVATFLAHDPANQRSQRKLREFLVTVCGSGGSKSPNPRKEVSTTSPPTSPPKQEQRTSSLEPTKPAESEDRIGTPQLLQTAFLQRQSPPKPKVFGIASSSFKDRSSGSSDVLMSMNSGPMKLSQKLMRGGKMNDYSEFEEEEEVDLQNLIGTKPTFSSGSSALGRSQQLLPHTMSTGRSTAKSAVEEDDEFDADF